MKPNKQCQRSLYPCETRRQDFTHRTPRQKTLGTDESCLFTMCCFSLPPVNRQMAALLLQGRELPDTLVTAWLVSGRFSTLTLGVWWAANVLEGRLTEEEMIMSPSSLERIKHSQFSAQIYQLGHNCKAFDNRHL